LGALINALNAASKFTRKVKYASTCYIVYREGQKTRPSLCFTTCNFINIDHM